LFCFRSVCHSKTIKPWFQNACGLHASYQCLLYVYSHLTIIFTSAYDVL
jgi:hypothetical protein